MPVRWDGVVRRDLQEHICVRFGRVAAQDGNLAPLRKQRRAWTPFELRIMSIKGNRHARGRLRALSDPCNGEENTERSHKKPPDRTWLLYHHKYLPYLSVMNRSAFMRSANSQLPWLS